MEKKMATEAQTAVSTLPCPHCGYEQDQTKLARSDNIQPHVPHGGNATICVECGNWAMFTGDKDKPATGMRFPTHREMNRLLEDPKARALGMILALKASAKGIAHDQRYSRETATNVELYGEDIGAGAQYADLLGAMDGMVHHAAAARVGMTLLAKERKKQIDMGYDPDHDDKHTNDELIRAGITYAMLASGHSATAMGWWPFEPNTLRPRDRRADLVRAVALMMAALEADIRKDMRRGPVDQ